MVERPEPPDLEELAALAGPEERARPLMPMAALAAEAVIPRDQPAGAARAGRVEPELLAA
jgi:hypothetical protein